MKLYSYFRSSAAYRLRIALNLKCLAYEQVPISLLKDEQSQDSYAAINPQRLVPALDDGGELLTQSMAICEYLDETYPDPPLLPKNAPERARVRALSLAIACEIHPLNNLRVLKYLKHTLKQDDEQRNNWYRHWIAEGLAPVEKMLAASPRTGRFCHGDMPGLADIFLVPQIFNALRYECSLDAYPTIRRINDECLNLPAFAAAKPDAQPDAVS